MRAAGLFASVALVFSYHSLYTRAFLPLPLYAWCRLPLRIGCIVLCQGSLMCLRKSIRAVESCLRLACHDRSVATAGMFRWWCVSSSWPRLVRRLKRVFYGFRWGFWPRRLAQVADALHGRVRAVRARRRRLQPQPHQRLPTVGRGELSAPAHNDAGTFELGVSCFWFAPFLVCAVLRSLKTYKTFRGLGWNSAPRA